MVIARRQMRTWAAPAYPDPALHDRCGSAATGRRAVHATRREAPGGAISLCHMANATLDQAGHHGRVRSLLAGPVRALRSPRIPGGEATAWRSAILKSARTSAVIGPLGLIGDAQKEQRHHGGPDKAVLVYGGAHYTRWAESLAPHAACHAAALQRMSADVDASVFGDGAFGENVTAEGLTEREVCVGDLWQLGSCILRVTEPRAPCATLTRRWMRPELLREVIETAAAGWYNAVQREGTVNVGDPLVLLERVDGAFTVERVFRLLETRSAPRDEVIALREHPATHDALRARLDRRLAARAR